MKQTKPLTDEERVRLRHSLGLNGRSFLLTIDGVERQVSFKLTRKQDTVMEVLSGETVWWLSDCHVFVRRVRLDGIQTSWKNAIDKDKVEPPHWWTAHSHQGGNKLFPLGTCAILERVFQLALSESITEAILS